MNEDPPPRPDESARMQRARPARRWLPALAVLGVVVVTTLGGFVAAEAVTTEPRRFEKPSFDAYFEPYERGWGSAGQAYVALPEEARVAMREEVRRALGDAGGPIGVDMEVRIASGQR